MIDMSNCPYVNMWLLEVKLGRQWECDRVSKCTSYVSYCNKRQQINNIHHTVIPIKTESTRFKRGSNPFQTGASIFVILWISFNNKSTIRVTFYLLFRG